MKNYKPIDKKKRLRKTNHLTRPPRLEGKVKNAKMNPVRKTRKNILHSPLVKEPDYIITENGYEEYEDGESLYDKENKY